MTDQNPISALFAAFAEAQATQESIETREAEFHRALCDEAKMALDNGVPAEGIADAAIRFAAEMSARSVRDGSLFTFSNMIQNASETFASAVLGHVVDVLAEGKAKGQVAA